MRRFSIRRASTCTSPIFRSKQSAARCSPGIACSCLRRSRRWRRTRLRPRTSTTSAPTRTGPALYMALYGGNNSLGGNNNNPIPERTSVLERPGDLGSSRRLRTGAERAAQVRQLHVVVRREPADRSRLRRRLTASAHATEYIIHQNGKEYVATTDESAADWTAKPGAIRALYLTTAYRHYRRARARGRGDLQSGNVHGCNAVRSAIACS